MFMKKRYPIVKPTLFYLLMTICFLSAFAGRKNSPEHRSPKANINWTGAVSSDWNNSNNWQGLVLPSTNSNVSIPAGLSRYPVVNSGNPNVNTVTLETGSGNQPTLTISSGTFTVTGNFNIDAGTLTQTGGTIVVSSGGMDVTGNFVQSGGIFLSNIQLNIKTNGTLTQTGGTIHMAGNTGTAPTDNVVVAGDGTIIQSAGQIDTKDITIQSGGSYAQSGSGLLKMYHNYKNSGTFIATSGTVEFADDGSSQAWPSASAIDQFYNVTVDAGNTVVVDKAGTIKISGNWTNNGTVVITKNSNVVEFNGSGAQNIGGTGITTFYSLVTSGSGIKTAGMNIIANSLDNGGSSNTASTFYIGPYLLLAASIDNTNATIEFSGATNGLVLSTGTVLYDGTSQTLTAGTYNALSVMQGGTKSMGGSVSTGSLTLNSGSSLTIGSNTLTINGPVTGTGVLKGSSTSNLVIGSNAGMLNFDQTSAATRSVKNLTFNSGSSATLGTAMDVYGDILLTASTFNLNNKNLTLRSTSTYTARIGNLTGSTLSNATNVTIERYIKDAGGATGGRRYRLLTPTVNTSGSIKDNWMEGQMNTAIGTNVNNIPGYGVQITGAGGNANGFDKTASNASSLYTVTNGSTLTYSAVGSTSGTLNAKTGYFLFIRGDRSMNMTLPSTVNMPTSATTLRATGSLITGTQTNFTNSLTGGAGNLNLITNPYPSPIDWSLLQPACSNISQYYTFWDPEVGSRGAFVTVKTDGTRSNSSSAGTVKIQAGQAFFVQATGAATPVISLQESHKSTGDNVSVFRTTTGPAESFAIDLNAKWPDDTYKNADGVLALFDNNYSAAVDADDANEISNWDENIAISRPGAHLAIEARPVITANDTIFLFMNNMKQQDYQFEFTPTAFSNTNLKAELVDNFTGLRTLLSVTAQVTFNFSVTPDPASRATDRFKIVFSPLAPLPVSFTGIKAIKKIKTVEVEWEVAGQLNISKYEVERSNNGTDFIYAATQAASGSGTLNASYSWTDNNPAAGYNFYRVKSVGIGGEVKYSGIVKVEFGNSSYGIKVVSNPFTSNTITMLINNNDKCNYQWRLVSNDGLQVAAGEMQHDGGLSTRNIVVPSNLAKGIYHLQISTQGRSQICLDVLAAQ